MFVETNRLIVGSEQGRWLGSCCSNSTYVDRTPLNDLRAFEENVDTVYLSYRNDSKTTACNKLLHAVEDTAALQRGCVVGQLYSTYGAPLYSLDDFSMCVNIILVQKQRIRSN